MQLGRGHRQAKARHARSSLRVRLLASTLLATIPALALLLRANLEQRRIEKNKAGVEVQRLVGLLASQEQDLIDEAHQFLVAVAVLPDLQIAHCDRLFASLREKAPFLASLGLAMPDGTVSCSPVGPAHPVSVGDQRYFQEATSRRDFAVGDYALDRLSQRPTFGVAYPILSGGRVSGVAFANIDLAGVNQVAARAGLPPTSRVVVLDRNGVVLARYPNPAPVTGHKLPRSPLSLALAAPWPSGRTVAVAGSDKVRRLWAFDPLGDPQHPSAQVVVGVTVASVVGPMNAIAEEALRGVALVGVLSLLVAWLLGDFLVVRPVVAILDATRRVAAGDLDIHVNHRGKGELAELGAAFEDMAARLHQRDDELRAAERRFRAAFDNAPIGMALLSLGNPDRGCLLEVNSSLCRLSGRSAEELVGTKLASLFVPSDAIAHRHDLARLARGEVDRFDAERRLFHRHGSLVWVRTVASLVRDDHGEPLYAVNELEDVTDRKEAERRLVHLALHDPLTGLPNRQLAMDRIRQAQASFSRNGRRFALLFVDLDRFKIVNDSLGHDAGDELLVIVANRLCSILRASDTAARLGGDEFLVCCEDLDSDERAAYEQTVDIAARLTEAIAVPVSLRNNQLHVTASIGICLPDDSAAPPDELLPDADVAMYRAKEKGGGRFEVFDVALRRRVVEHMELESALYRALEGNEFEMRYQPIIDLRESRPVGAEALLRWRHPDGELVPASQFIEVAEASGLIVPMGEWVLQRVCEDVTWWARQGVRLPVTANLSARQLAAPGFAAFVTRVLDDNGLQAQLLSLEVTETALLELTGPALTELEGLARQGISVGVDDFGTGYASLTHLRRLPIHFVKVDRSFVARVGESREDAAIVKAVVALGEELGMGVVAEGVESSMQAEMLAGLGCQLAQGWRFGRPQSPGQLVKTLCSVH